MHQVEKVGMKRRDACVRARKPSRQFYHSNESVVNYPCLDHHRAAKERAKHKRALDQRTVLSSNPFSKGIRRHFLCFGLWILIKSESSSIRNAISHARPTFQVYTEKKRRSRLKKGSESNKSPWLEEQLGARVSNQGRSFGERREYLLVFYHFQFQSQSSSFSHCLQKKVNLPSWCCFSSDGKKSTRIFRRHFKVDARRIFCS